MSLYERLGGVYAIAAVVVVSLAVVATAYLAWQRESGQKKEWALLFAGDQMRQAIGEYYEQSPGDIKQLPQRLEVLVRDTRNGLLRSHLIKLLPEPLTASGDWGVVSESGRIVGVYSKAEGEPVLQEELPGRYRNFADKKSYAEWRFVYVPSAPAVAVMPSAVRPPPRQPALTFAQAEPTVAAFPAPPRPSAPHAVSIAGPVEFSEQQAREQPCNSAAANTALFCTVIGARNGEVAEASCKAYVEARRSACLQGQPLPAVDRSQWQ